MRQYDKHVARTAYWFCILCKREYEDKYSALECAKKCKESSNRKNYPKSQESL